MTRFCEFFEIFGAFVSLSPLLRLCIEFVPAPRENCRSKVDASDMVFLKIWKTTFLTNLVGFSALRTAPRNCVRIERAPLKSRSFGLGFPQNSSFQCHPATTTGTDATLIATIPVFIDYQFITPYYEDARAVSK
jgi:hypothetical protein